MKVEKSYLIEVPVNSAPSSLKKYQFPQNIGPLANATIVGIEVYPASDIAASPTAKTPVSLAGCRSAVLTMFTDSTERLRQIPLINLIPTSQGGIQREFKPFKWNVNQSYIQLLSAANVNLNESFVINFLYE